MNLKRYMKRPTTAFAVLIVVVVVGHLMTAKTNAQAENNGNPTILNAVQNGVNSLSELLTTLQTSVDQLTTSADSNVRVTPAAYVSTDDLVICKYVNASTASHTVRLELIRGDGTILDTGTNTVAAGRAQTGNTRSVSNAMAFCQFTVLDGSRTDIRGTIAIQGKILSNGVLVGSTSDRLAIPAE